MIDARINILGASGSGASTVGRAVASALSLPYFDCDDYFHAPSDPPFSSPRSPLARYELIVRDLRADDSWVLAGGVAGWDPTPELEFTLIVYLWVPWAVRERRLRERERKRFGDRIRPGGDMYHAHEEFLSWASHYDSGEVEGKTMQTHEAYLAAQNRPVLELRGERTLDSIREAIIDRVGWR